MIFRATPIYEAETPLRKVCNVFRMNFLSRLLRDIKGVGCRIEKVWTLGGLGWRVVVDGNSDEPFPDGVTPPWQYTPDPYPFELEGRLNEGTGEVRCRGGSVDIMLGDYTITTLQIASGDVDSYSGWVTSYGDIGLEIDASNSDIANWTISFASWSEWPDDETDTIKLRLGTDLYFGMLEPLITQLWRGGNIRIELSAILSDDTPTAVGTASAGVAMTVSRSDHAHNVLLDDIQAADSNTALIPDTDDTLSLAIGGTGARWTDVLIHAVDNITAGADDIRLLSTSSGVGNTGIRSSGGRVQVYGAGLSGSDDGYAESDGVNALAEFYASGSVGYFDCHAWTLFRGLTNTFTNAITANGGIVLPDGENIVIGDGDIRSSGTASASINPEARKGFESDGTESLNWSSQQSAIADVATGGSATAAANATAINSILAVLRAYKIIAT